MKRGSGRLSEKRFREAESNVKNYFEEGLLRKTDADQNIIRILISNAKESLRVSQELSRINISDLWVIVCSYYAMFYYAQAVLLKLGYRVGDRIAHKVASDALIVFVRNKLKESILENYEETRDEALNLARIRADELIESFDLERRKRSHIQYKTVGTEKKSKAHTSLQRAKEFSKEIEKLLM